MFLWNQRIIRLKSMQITSCIEKLLRFTAAVNGYAKLNRVLNESSQLADLLQVGSVKSPNISGT